MLKYSYSLIFFIFFNNIFSQETELKTIMTLAIMDAEENGYDITEELVSQKGYLVLFYSGEIPRMAIVLSASKSQSNGVIRNIEMLEDQDKNSVFLFDWKYYNNYNDGKGTAVVKLTLIKKDQGTAYNLRIITDELDVLTYKGYVDGTLDKNLLLNDL